MTAPRKRPVRRASSLDKAAARIARMYETSGETCWRSALEAVARCDAGEIVGRLDAARRSAARALDALGLDDARRAELRRVLDDACLYAGARLWFERAKNQTGPRDDDALDDAMRAWAAVSKGEADMTWYALRYRAAADLMEALGLPRPLALRAAQPAEAGWRAQ